jgi:hypothetical protein
MDRLLSEEEFYEKAASTAGQFILKNTGATDTILRKIFT